MTEHAAATSSEQRTPAPPPAGAGIDQANGGGGSHLQPPVDVNQPSSLPFVATPGFNAGMVDLSPSAVRPSRPPSASAPRPDVSPDHARPQMDSNLVAPDASIEDILQMYADVFPFTDPNAASSFDGTQTPNFSTSFVGSSFPTF